MLAPLAAKTSVSKVNQTTNDWLVKTNSFLIGDFILIINMIGRQRNN